MRKITLFTTLFFCCLQISYAQPGELDPGFGTNGIVNSDFSLGKPICTVIQKDGKILLGIGDGHVSRYNSNGILDSTFGENGTVTTDFGILSIAIQGNDKFTVAGTIAGLVPATNPDFAVARFNSDGTPDNTFGTDGKQITDFGSNFVDRTSSVTVQSDGRIVLSGVSSPDFELKNFRNVIVRYNIDGSPDSSFNGEGKLVTDMDGDVGEVCRNVAIQSDGKLIIARFITGSNLRDFAVARYNADGSKDNTFDGDGLKTADLGYDDIGVAVAVQTDGKIVVSGFVNYPVYTGINYSDMCVIRLNTDGGLDSSFSDDGIQITNAHANNLEEYNYALALQNDGKILIAGLGTYALVRYNTDGSLDKTFSGDGQQQTPGTINDLAIFNNKLYAVLDYKGLARYLLDSVRLTVKIITPTNNATFLAPAAHIKLSATASSFNGTITKVEFYKNSTLVHTEYVAPYGYVWRKVPLDNYTITAKAYDNSGNVTTSAPVHISVVPNKPPVVSIINPAGGESFTAPATIAFTASAEDTDGRITKVEFYNGTVLLRTERKLPYTYHWPDVPAGTYTITAVATDNWGARTTSASVTVSVTTNSAIVSSKPYSQNKKTAQNDALHLRLSPNPATNIVNINTSGLQQNKPATLSIISVSGIVLKNIQISNSSTQLDVSTLASGVYTIKIASAGRILYKQFVKL